ncbi:MAG: formylglycine-generating enzyme family protein [Planctomycetia bacterium]|nr:formylglycine-generating enzyme family protein [Planctomycetia bacterium]
MDAPAPSIAPFDAKRAKQHQEAWAAHLKLPVEFTNSIGMKFRLIPPGEFLMGSTPEEIEVALKVAAYPDWREKIVSEGPQHRVVLTKPNYVGVTEVTQLQYEQVMGTNPSRFSATGKGKDLVANLETGRHPVENVTWNDAAEFCAKLSQQELVSRGASAPGQSVKASADARDDPPGADAPRLANTNASTGYRLPTEAEWEHACRAGTTTRFWSGDEDQDLTRAGRFLSNSGGRTHSAGELKANPFGFSDVHGNVWEYVLDGWDPGFYRQFQARVATDPFRRLSADSMPISRGGCGTLSSELLRSASRLYLSPPRDLWTGFRVVLIADAVKKLLGKTEVNAPPPAVVPFDETQARAHQEKWAMHLGVPVEYENSLGF